MEALLRISSITILIVVLSAGVYLAEKKTPFGKIKFAYKQIIIGVLFGIVTCLASEYGAHIPGAIINVRDAAPLCAGLLFGGPAGIIAGVIGAVHRLFWGTDFVNTFTLEWITTMFSVNANGGFTRIACTLGTFFSGAFGAVMRKYMFENRRPSWIYGILVGLTTEVMHLFLVFVFRLDYLSRAYDVILACSAPMIAANTLAVVASLLIVRLISKEKREKLKNRKQDLSKAFQKWLLVCVTVSFCATTLGMGIIQNNLAIQQTQATLDKTVEDICERIKIDGGIEKFISNNFSWHIGNGGGNIIGKFITDENGETAVEVVLNGEEYNKGEIISGSKMKGGSVQGANGNFFSSTIHINKVDTEIYGTYKIIDKSYIIISYVPLKEATMYQGVSLVLLMFFEILVFAALFINVYYLIKKLVVDNLNRVNSTLDEITGGNLNATVDVNSHSEFIYLSDEINKTVDKLKEYIAEAAARIDNELAFAKSIQHSAIPNVFPPFPNRKDFDIFASMHTAKEVGGDFYDYYFVGEDKLAFLIADVSGKGVPAAMFMMQAKTLIKGYAESGMDVADVLTVANEKLCERNDAGMFVTVFMCIADLKTGVIKYANAGHNLPVINHGGKSCEFLKAKGGLVLAGMEGIKYRMGETKLEKGDTIYLYTDGVVEANNVSNELFGDDRLISVMNQNAGADVKTLCEKIKQNVDEFAGEAEQFDDITMLAFQLKGEDSVKELTLDAAIESIEPLTAFVDEILEQAQCSMKAQMQIDVAIDEIFGNIAKYAYDSKVGKATVKVKIEAEPKKAVITFIDSGIQYDPLAKEDPNVALSAEDREIGGLGIFVVKKTMDNLYYEYKDNQNIFTIEKLI